MTGFGRASAQSDESTIQCEIKSVNGRGLDVRVRLTPGFEWVEPDIRRLVSERLVRGSVSLNVAIHRETSATEVTVNEGALESVLEVASRLGDRLGARMPSVEGVLGIKGVLEIRETPLDGDAEALLRTAVLDCAGEAVDALVESREREGARMGDVLVRIVDEIDRLTGLASGHPARERDAILARLREQVTMLVESDNGLNAERLHTEAMLLATKADIREELDRLQTHVTAARDLMSKGGPVGRRLDFLAQEFNREANTLCSKSNDVGLTAIGLDLKAAIDQLREQVQNLE